jgi:hypothetical protein
LDPWPLDEGPKPKSGKSWLNLHGTILEGKSIGSHRKKKKKKKKKRKKKKKSSQRELMIWKLKM